MLVKEIKMSNKINSFNLAILGDMHLGDSLCDLDLIKSTINYISGIPNTIVILNGDLINNALKTSVSDIYNETMSIERQQDLLIELLTPIKEKIAIMCSGNHEQRTNIIAGIDPLKYICKALNLPDNTYCSGSYAVSIKYGNNYGHYNVPNQYVLYGTHGSHSGGKRAGATANAMEDMNKILANADLYIHSHTHSFVNFTDNVCIYQYDKIQVKTRTYYNTPAFLSYGGYAEDAGFKMTDRQQNIVTVNTIRTKTGMRTITNIVKIPV